MKCIALWWMSCLALPAVGQKPGKITPYCELQEWGLKGQVKSITNLIFNNVMLKGENPTLPDTSKWDTKAITLFNTAGNAVSIENRINPMKKSLFRNSIVRFTYTDSTRLGVEINGGDTLVILNRRRLSDSSYIEVVTDKKGNKSSAITTVLTPEGRIFSQRIESLTPYDISVPVNITFVFNENNRLTKAIVTSRGGDPVTETNTDLLFDKTGNAIKSIKSSGKKGRTIILRTYTYY
jgi:hypothetical protein